jgi:hypothetical protein
MLAKPTATTHKQQTNREAAAQKKNLPPPRLSAVFWSKRFLFFVLFLCLLVQLSAREGRLTFVKLEKTGKEKEKRKKRKEKEKEGRGGESFVVGFIGSSSENCVKTSAGQVDLLSLTSRRSAAPVTCARCLS